MYRKYYSYNDMPKPVIPDSIKVKETEAVRVKDEVKTPQKLHIEKDDIILIAVLLTLLLNSCEDKLLILAVGALLFM